jgi:hypothetical protein
MGISMRLCWIDPASKRLFIFMIIHPVIDEVLADRIPDFSENVNLSNIDTDPECLPAGNAFRALL